MKSILKLTVLSFTLLAAQAAFAGRPLSVDDPSINDEGKGHVETYMVHATGSTVFAISPAFALTKNLEIAAVLARESSAKTLLTGVQGKYSFTKGKDDKCGSSIAAGVNKTNQGGASTPFVTGALACDLGGVNAIVNLNYAKASGSVAEKGWGLAFEKEVANATTAHIEFFGTKGSSSTTQVGLRRDIAKGIQLDGTFGRNSGVSLYSLGMKFSF